MDSPFSKEEIEAEERRPKKKVAVMIGYAGSGYKGMQINNAEKTIEGDIFKAFVAASAISKANADDPKKSALVRCARTDKGVHAAGNVISLKLIVEDEDVVKKINEHLPPQIRVWDIQRTNKAFSCYQTCDSRWYEYLIPTYCFLPPHPKSYLGKELLIDAAAAGQGLYESYTSRQEDILSFWEEADREFVEPILEKLDPQMRADALAIVHSEEDKDGLSKTALKKAAKQKQVITNGEGNVRMAGDVDTCQAKEEAHDADPSTEEEIRPSTVEDLKISIVEDIKPSDVSPKAVLTPLEAAVKEIKAAHIEAKKAYRISEVRRKRLQDALSEYVGTCNFHNYTIEKSFHDASAKRHIKSFKVSEKPININDTEWLSLKVHGQSFMMHQIRKMVAMAALVVRCGASTDLIRQSYGRQKISIPKAPGLGLLLERPVFNSYNDRAVREFKLEKIDFDKYRKETDEFKQREIYDRIFREEDEIHQ